MVKELKCRNIYGKYSIQYSMQLKLDFLTL